MEAKLLDELKENIFSVLLKQTSIIDFENWLYSQDEIINSIENEKFIYDLVTINYKEENAYQLLRSKAFEKFKYEEYVVLVIGINCEKILLEDNWDGVYNLFYDFFDYDKEYGLMWSFSSINSRMDLVELGYETKTSIYKEIKELSQKVVNQLKELNTADDRVSFLENGFDNFQIEESKKEKSVIKKSIVKNSMVEKKWYEFWK